LTPASSRLQSSHSVAPIEDAAALTEELIEAAPPPVR